LSPTTLSLPSSTSETIGARTHGEAFTDLVEQSGKSVTSSEWRIASPSESQKLKQALPNALARQAPSNPADEAASGRPALEAPADTTGEDSALQSSMPPRQQPI
jgi:hypothetical protein